MNEVAASRGAWRSPVWQSCLLALLPAFSAAAQFLPSGGAGVSYSDNLTRQQPAKADAMYGIEAGLRFLNTASRWSADIDARATHTEFVKHSYDSQTLGWGVAQLGLSLLPRTVSWELEDNYGQAATDPFGAIQPSDRQNINYLTTGPNLTLPVGGANRFDVQGRYSAVDYSSSSTLNNQRYSATAAFVHQLTGIRTLAINVYEQRTNFARTELFRDYNLSSAYLTLISSPRRSQFEIDVGATQVDDGLTSHRGALVSAGITHQLNDSNSIQLYGRRGFADSADTFRFEQGAGSSEPFLIGANVQVRADPFTETRAQLAFTSIKPRDTITFVAYWVREDYVNNRFFNRRLYGVSANATYTWNPEVRLDGRVTYDRDSFASGLQSNKDLALSFMVTRRLTAALDLNFRAERYNRRGSANPFTENRAVVSVIYAPQPRTGRTSRAAPSFLDQAHGTNSRPTIRPAPRGP